MVSRWVRLTAGAFPYRWVAGQPGVADGPTACIAPAVRAVVESAEGLLHLVEEVIDGLDQHFGSYGVVGTGRTAGDLVGPDFGPRRVLTVHGRPVDLARLDLVVRRHAGIVPAGRAGSS